MTGLPANYQLLDKKQRTDVLLENKLADTANYKNLRDQAMRCAPDSPNPKVRP